MKRRLTRLHATLLVAFVASAEVGFAVGLAFGH